MPWSALIGAGANLLGGALNSSSSNAANKKAQDIANQNMSMQSDFAQHALTWRAKDAMKAYNSTGIHPLAMLGVQGASYSPVSANFVPSGMGDSVSRAGQSVARAIDAGGDRRLRARQLEMQEVQMNNAAERGLLENELLRLKIAAERALLLQGSRSPGIPGRGAARAVTALGLPTERFTNPDVSFTDTADRGVAPVKGKEAQERLEDDWLGNIWWNVRNRILPRGQKRLLGKPSAGMYWDYNPVRGAWYERPLPWTTQAPIRFDKRR